MQQKQQQQHIISLIINTVGLFSNLWVFYCVHYVYPNPYADGFGGHFQVSEALLYHLYTKITDIGIA